MGCAICIDLVQIFVQIFVRIFGMPFVAMGIRLETLWLAFLDIFTVDKLFLMVGLWRLCFFPCMVDNYSYKFFSYFVNL